MTKKTASSISVSSSVATKTDEIRKNNKALRFRIRDKIFGSERSFKTTISLTLMALPGIVVLFVFAYLPMFGLIIAFKDYRFADGILGSQWVGLQNFKFLFGTDTAWRITRNTLLMNSLFIIVNTTGGLGVALLLNEVYKSWVSKFYQTVLLFPYFFSWGFFVLFCLGLFKANGRFF